MKFNRANFTNLLSTHQANLDRKAIDPIFSSINLKIENGKLHIISTDTQRYLEQIIDYQSENKCIFVNGMLLYDIIRKSKSDEFEFIEENSSDNSYTILIDSAKFKISQIIKSINQNWEDETEVKIKIQANLLNESIKTVKWAASSDESRPALTGVCFDFYNDTLTLCSTDGLKLAIAKLFDNFKLEGRWLLNKKSIGDLIKILDECESQEVSLKFGKYFTLEYENEGKKVIWKSLFVLDNFPPYQKILLIENQFNNKFTIDSKKICSIIDRIMIAANQNQPSIIFNFSSEASTISSENTILAGVDILPIKYEGPNIKIILNGRFLQEMFANISDDITFLLKDPISPIAVKPTINSNIIFIVAPIKPNF